MTAGSQGGRVYLPLETAAHCRLPVPLPPSEKVSRPRGAGACSRAPCRADRSQRRRRSWRAICVGDGGKSAARIRVPKRELASRCFGAGVRSQLLVSKPACSLLAGTCSQLRPYQRLREERAGRAPRSDRPGTVAARGWQSHLEQR